jgi:hypothetical protein
MSGMGAVGGSEGIDQALGHVVDGHGRSLDLPVVAAA